MDKSYIIKIGSDIFSALGMLRDTYKNAEISGCISLKESGGASGGASYEAHNIYILYPFTHKMESNASLPPAVSRSEICRVRADFDANVIFHTHPEQCYLSHIAYIGIPSLSDIAFSIDGCARNGHLINIVVAVEGYYTFIVQPRIAEIVRKNTAERDRIIKHLESIHNSIDKSDAQNRRILIVKDLIDAINKSGVLKMHFFPYAQDLRIYIRTTPSQRRV